MSRIEEIEAAIDGLPADDYRRIVEWFRDREQARWDDQMDRDSSAGKLDFLFAEAKSEAGTATDPSSATRESHCR